MAAVWNYARRNAARSLTWSESIHRPEWVALVYFSYLAVLGLVRPLTAAQRIPLIVLPMALCWLWRLESNASRPWTRVVREWASLGLILVGYWSLQWFSAPPIDRWQSEWVSWDRALLDTFGLRRALESAGSALPSLLESVYLALYAIPPVSLGLLYAYGERKRVNRFLLVLFLGTFTAYALLPLFPVQSPRMAFPGADNPAFHGSARSINTWLLDRLDISTGVFPSGHVAVAFSSAFGLLSVFRGRRIVWMGAFLVATLVYVATIYGRYHYAVDGLASAAITFCAWRVAERKRTDAA